MSKKTEQRETPKRAMTIPQQFEDSTSVTDVVEETIQSLENAMTSLDIAFMKLNAENGSVMRIVNARRGINDVIRNLKPYLEG